MDCFLGKKKISKQCFGLSKKLYVYVRKSAKHCLRISKIKRYYSKLVYTLRSLSNMFISYLFVLKFCIKENISFR